MAERQGNGKKTLDTADIVRQAIEDTFLTGRIPENIALVDDDEVRQRLERVLADIIAIQQFTLAMAHGDLSQDLAVKGYHAGSLKSLQSNFRHLTWQAKQIASGDLTQRVHFMGDFSASFNAMVEHLSDDEINRTRREEALKEANAALAEEITSHRLTLEALKLTNRKLNLLSSITRHDIKNQLTALVSLLYLHRQVAGNPAASESYFDKEDGILTTIINQINFTKDYEDLGIKEPVWNSLESIIADLTSTLPFGKVRLVTEIAGVEIYADLLVSKVFYNLIDNALRYGGETMTEIRIMTGKTEEGLVITVQDDGAGIPAECRENLFTRGYGKNTGFGLHLSREILSLTGISITEVSEPGSGARFRIKVPEGMYRFH